MVCLVKRPDRLLDSVEVAELSQKFQTEGMEGAGPDFGRGVRCARGEAFPDLASCFVGERENENTGRSNTL